MGCGLVRPAEKIRLTLPYRARAGLSERAGHPHAAGQTAFQVQSEGPAKWGRFLEAEVGWHRALWPPKLCSCLSVLVSVWFCPGLSSALTPSMMPALPWGGIWARCALPSSCTAEHLEERM